MSASFSIDWLSISLPALAGSDISRGWLESTIPEFTSGDVTWERCGGRAPFSNGYRSPLGATFYFKREGALLEISGTGCTHLQRFHPSAMTEFLGMKVTRIDVAYDFDGLEVEPVVKDAKLHGFFDTQTGKTAYIGSPKSDTMARVYRYAEPHPRADKLRYELVFRRKNAQAVADAFAADMANDVHATCVAFAKKRKLDLPLSSETGVKIVFSSAKADKGQAGTVRWLQKSVKPAIKKLLVSGNFTKAELKEMLGL